MLTEWMVQPLWLALVIAGLIGVVLLATLAAWQHVDETEGYES